ncbi:MAG: F0F1 ATP synthase subunit gamma, partial [Cyanobacteria bacterium P01_A01_bin.83]
MATIEELKHQITTADDLKSVVKTMKALAAVSIHQYEQAVASQIEYSRTLEMGWQILLQRDPHLLFKPKISPPKKVGLVVFGSDWGMCGQFNERIADYTQKVLCDRDIETLMVNVGSKIATCLQTRGYNCDASFNLPSSVTGITAVVRQIVLTLENWRQQNQINRIDLIYNCIDSGIHYYPRQLQIFPLNLVWLQQLKQKKWSGSSLPGFTMDKHKLASALFQQYFFVTL